MKTKKLLSLVAISIIAILMLTVALGSVQAVDAAPKKVKVTWHANGGKIGTAKTKVTTVKKNAKIGKLLKAPTRTGYTFNGWYTKKVNGKKITTTTKVKNKVTFHAQWKKKTNPNIDPKLLGTWKNTGFASTSSGGLVIVTKMLTFFEDGTFLYVDRSTSTKGNYKASGGKVTITNAVIQYNPESGPQKYSNTVVEYKFVNEDGTEHLKIATFAYPDNTYLDLSFASTWRR